MKTKDAEMMRKIDERIRLFDANVFGYSFYRGHFFGKNLPDEASRIANLQEYAKNLVGISPSEYELKKIDTVLSMYFTTKIRLKEAYEMLKKD